MERSLILKAFTDNPIVLRDLRTTMRGTRSFWFQGIYLLLLGVLAVTGYAISTGQSFLPQNPATGAQFGGHVIDMVEAQSRLQSFYYYIFVTLAALVTLIAPALTATSVTDERQRQSLDLLVTTPISAFEMLVGKLISSLAFLGLLLALSLPASALCVLLGGATIADILRTYFILAIDAVVLASIGLYFSCTSKTSLQAILWTYVSVAAYVAVTLVFLEMSATNQSLEYVGNLRPAVVIGLLSPFGAIFPVAGQNIAIGPASIPAWILLIPVSFLVIRLILTAATYRFGFFGGDCVRSLRKQILGVTGLGVFLLAYSAGLSQGPTRDGTCSDGNIIIGISLAMIGIAAMAVPFLPGLFVPVHSEDASPGESASDRNARDHGVFRFSAVLLPRHAGALPFFLLWVAVAVAVGWSGFSLGFGMISWEFNVAVVAPTIYVIGAGITMWGLARLAGSFRSQTSSARALTFCLFLLCYALPALPLTLGGTNWDRNAWISPYQAFLIGPFLYTDHSTGLNNPMENALVLSGVVAVLFGLAAGHFARKREA